MASNLEVVAGYMKAMEAKDIDAALAVFSPDATVQSPMGPQKGHAEIRRGLEMVASMPALGAPPTLSEENGQVIARGSSPMGPMTITFDVADGKIVKQAIALG